MRQIVVTVLIVSFSVMTTQAATGLGQQVESTPLERPGWHGPSGRLVIQPAFRLAQGGSLWTLSSRTPVGLRFAQIQQQQTQLRYTTSQGFLDGQMHAEGIGTGGNFAGGLACGFLLGLIGTGLVYFLTGSAHPGARAFMTMEGKGSDYRMGFESGFKKKSRSRKRNAALGGGLLGTLGFLVLIASANS